MEAVFYFLTNLIFGIIAVMILIGSIMYIVGVTIWGVSSLPWYGWLQAGDGE